MGKSRTVKRKATNLVVHKGFLQERARYAMNAGYTKQKWIEFCETLLEQGYRLTLYEARETVSKYVTVMRGDKQFKVRFSNHPPIRHREEKGDCDFFVGRTHLAITTTREALKAVDEFFNPRPFLNFSTGNFIY